MSTNREQIDRAIVALKQAERLLADVRLDAAPKKSLADLFVESLSHNINNEQLSDANFRIFVRNTLRAVCPRFAAGTEFVSSPAEYE